MSSSQHTPGPTTSKHNADIWYGMCGYWTDEWERLKTAGQSAIPCCPDCGAVGFQASRQPWEEGARKFDQAQPGYLKFLNDNKNVCFRPFGGFLKRWQLERQKAPAQPPSHE